MRIFGLFSSLPFYSKFILILFVLLLSFILFNIIGIIITLLLFNLNLPNFLEIIKNIDYDSIYQVNILKTLQIIQTIGLFIVPPVITAYLFTTNGFNYLRINKNVSFIFYILAAVILYTSLPLIEFSLELNSKMQFPESLSNLEKWMKDAEENAAFLIRIFLNVDTYSGLALNMLMIAILPAIGEELLFRGLFIRFFNERFQNAHISIIFSAFIFSVIHFQFYGFLPRMILGVLFGYLFVWSGSLWIPIFVHFLNNATAVITSFLLQKNIISEEPDKYISRNNEPIVIIISLLVVTCLLLLFYYGTKMKKGIEANQ